LGEAKNKAKTNNDQPPVLPTKPLSSMHYLIKVRCSEDAPRKNSDHYWTKSKNSVYASFLHFGSATLNVDVCKGGFYSYSVSRFGADLKPPELGIGKKKTT
jgi:hypothetical protein